MDELLTTNHQTVYPWGTHRRFNAYAEYAKQKYGGRVQKVSINAGFTCPNRDGKVAKGGCTYCNNHSFTPGYTFRERDIVGQIDTGIEFLNRRYKAKHYLAYFQAYSNTYAPLDKLIPLYQSALNHPQISGLAISTRPDCLPNEVLDYLQDLATKYIITLEIGIESCFDHTLERINRGHTFAQTIDALNRATNRGFVITGHLLLGMPGQTREQDLQQAEIVSGLPLDSVKLHHLQIIKHTDMADEYAMHPERYNLFESVEEYLDFIIEFITRLSPKVRLQRFAAESPPRLKIAPNWGNIRSEILTPMLEAELEKRNLHQGIFYKG